MSCTDSCSACLALPKGRGGIGPYDSVTITGMHRIMVSNIVIEDIEGVRVHVILKLPQEIPVSVFLSIRGTYY